MKINMIVRTTAIGILSAFFVNNANAQDKPKLSDAEVAFIAVTANQIDISYAEIAKQKSKDAGVIKFAQTMERDHKAVIAQAADLAKKLGVTPQANDVSKKLLDDAEKTKKDLRAKSAKMFDRAYIDNEVAYHKAVIAAVEGLLIPETENSELKQLLQNVVPALKAHLMHAEMLQKEIK
jgi:putative membrane protein